MSFFIFFLNKTKLHDFFFCSFHFNRDERRELNFDDWRNSPDFFGMFRPQRLHPSSIDRRIAESDDSSEEETRQPSSSDSDSDLGEQFLFKKF